MKIVDNNGQYKLTLPKDLVLDKGWKAGDNVRFVEDEQGRVFLRIIRRRGSKEEVDEDDIA